MGLNFIIGCVGKPSAGKSTFFNAATDGKAAKVGAYPFTTIEANQGVAYYFVDCPCKRFNVTCKPRFGTCREGRRTVPIKLLDVAGLIPGASEGLGLGNKFLDDLRQADILLHILDVSGTTNEKGEATSGYDPSRDHKWLLRYLTICGVNGQILVDAIQPPKGQLSGYGAQESLIQAVLDDLEIGNTSVDFSSWDKEKVLTLVSTFVKHRFAFVLVLNKADLGADADRNAIKISEEFDASRIVLASALSECFLKKLRDQKYIDYLEGSMFFSTAEDDPSLGLKLPDLLLKSRLDKVRDMVLFRLGSTGVTAAIQKAVELINIVPVFPVKNVQNFGAAKGGAFQECVLVKAGTTVRQFAKMLHAEIDRNFLYAEGPNGCRLAEHEPITLENNIIRYVTHRFETET